MRPSPFPGNSLLGAALRLLTLSAALLGGPAAQALPSANEIVTKVGPLIGLDPDQVEAARFSLKYPACASKIVSYTAAQDYSLVGLAAVFKASKLQSIPGMPPSMTVGSCKNYAPIKQVYLLIDQQGDKLLGKKEADFLRTMLAEQIASGQTAVDDYVASIPYVGTAIANWPCACEAGFDSNFQVEKMADAAVADGVKLATAAAAGNIDTVLEMLLAKAGPKIACEVGQQLLGTSEIPIVSGVLSGACASVAGKAVAWVSGGVGAVGVGLGIVPGKADRSPEDWYDFHVNKMYDYGIGMANYAQLSGQLYSACYKFFEPTDMSASTSREVCAILRDRYIDESQARIQWETFDGENVAYYKANMLPKTREGARLSDSAYAALANKAGAVCKSYFWKRYPKADNYGKTFSPSNSIAMVCDNFQNSWMPKERDGAQMRISQQVGKTLAPFCAVSQPNLVACGNLDAYGKCFKQLTKVCVPSPDGKGKEFPCCEVAQTEGGELQGKAKKHAAMVGGDYCRALPNDPLRIECATEETRYACYMQSKKSFHNLDFTNSCENVTKNEAGVGTTACCALNPAMLASVPGVAKAKATHAALTVSDPGAAIYPGHGSGQMTKADPRIVMVASGDMDKCRKLIGNPNACGVDANGYAPAACCNTGAEFALQSSAPTAVYDPSKRSPEQLARAAAAQKASGCTPASWSAGGIQIGAHPGGLFKSDPFRLQCASGASYQKCVVALGGDIRPAMSACSPPAGYKETPYVSGPCCVSTVAIGAKIDNPATQNGPIGGIGSFPKPADPVKKGGRPPPIVFPKN
jgi:hypothetical protein